MKRKSRKQTQNLPDEFIMMAFKTLRSERVIIRKAAAGRGETISAWIRASLIATAEMERVMREEGP